MYKHTLRATSFHHNTIATDRLSGEQNLCACRQLDGWCATGNQALELPVPKTLIGEQGCLYLGHQIWRRIYMHTACKSRYL